ncbi:hypothetical protein [Geminocystis sp. GBBB08]|uniref:GumC family protein n=1 Tax=Geminocystis sp. GBBB08 TaxID=2604140 RepID=UPI0027E22A9B|nr:hypothetical protein [Geminocystis sp. GBBB08]MBL1209348.1 hypothetical protein [Geminocystis sp. GBBB08]
MAYETETFPIEEVEDFSPSSATKKGNKLKLYFNILKRKKLLILAFILAFFFPILALITRDRVIYPGSFEMLVEPATSAEKLTDATTLARTGGKVDETLLTIDYPTILRILKSREILDQVAKNITDKYPSIRKGFLQETFRKDLIVEQAKQGDSRLDNTKIISVMYKGYDPNFVLFVLNEMVNVYLEYSKTEREKSLNSGIKFINDQLPKIKNRINNLQNQQLQLQLDNKLVNPQIKGEIVFQLNADLEKELLGVQSQLKELNILSNNIKRDIGLSSEESLIAPTLSQEPQRQQLLTQLQDVESQIALSSAKLTPNHPSLLTLKEQRQNINNLLNQKSDEILIINNVNPNINPRVFAYQDASRLALMQQLIDTQNQIDILSSRQKSLIENIAQTTKNLEIIPGVIQQYNELARQIELDTSILNQLTAQRETLTVEMAQKQIPWQLLSQPQIPIDKKGNLEGFRPNPTNKLIIGIGGGFFVGMIVSIAIEKRRDIVYEVSDLEYSFGLPILGTVEMNTEKNQKSKFESQNFFDIDDSIKESTPVSQISLGNIYTELHFKLPQSQKKNILVSSLNPEDDQAYITANLAKTAGNIGEKVLLIDANITKPEVHKYFEHSTQEKGLRDLLEFPMIQDSFLSEIATEKNVSILGAGGDDSDLPFSISAEETQSLIQSIAKDYSVILYNSSFFLESYDPSLLAEKTQGIVFVVKIEETPLSLLIQAINRIEAYNLNFLGFIVIT